MSDKGQVKTEGVMMVLQNYPLFGVFPRGNYWDVLSSSWVYGGIQNKSPMARDISNSIRTTCRSTGRKKVRT